MLGRLRYIDYPDFNCERALQYNLKQGYPGKVVARIQSSLGLTPSSKWTACTFLKVLEFQSDNGLHPDGKVGPKTYQKITATWPILVLPLTATDRDRIIGFTVRFEGGARDPYGATNLDGEYRGLFDKPRKDDAGHRIPVEDRTHRNPNSRYHASGGSHVGISIGAWQHTQRSGGVGKVLKEFRRISEEDFYAAFGGKSNAEAVYAVATARGKTKSDKGRRCPRTLPVGSKDLWEDPWASRFRAAGKYESYRRAQRNVINGRLTKVLDFAKSYGFRSQADLAVLFDIAVQYGVGGMRTRVRRALGRAPDKKEADINKVLRELPESKRVRRRKILAAADTWIHYEW